MTTVTDFHFVCLPNHEFISHIFFFSIGCWTLPCECVAHIIIAIPLYLVGIFFLFFFFLCYTRPLLCIIYYFYIQCGVCLLDAHQQRNEPNYYRSNAFSFLVHTHIYTHTRPPEYNVFIHVFELYFNTFSLFQLLCILHTSIQNTSKVLVFKFLEQYLFFLLSFKSLDKANRACGQRMHTYKRSWLKTQRYILKECYGKIKKLYSECNWLCLSLFLV